jgi:ATP-dependent metalloprotease
VCPQIPNFFVMLRIQMRFFSEKKVLKLEQELLKQFDINQQRLLFKELLSSQNYKQLQQRFENPQLPNVSSRYSKEIRSADMDKIQTDFVILDCYISSLVLDGQPVAAKIQPLFTSTHQEQPPTITESRPHWIETDMSKWQDAIDKTHPNSQFTSSKRGIPKKDDGPIHVVLSEAWSWSKLARNLGSRIFFGILIMTGLSVVLEQQGVLRSGNF